MLASQVLRTAADVEAELVALGERLERGLARWLALVAEFDGLGAARRQGFRSTVEWLAWRCGLSLRAAREHVRVARRLLELPATASAFARGGLSYSKVRALTRAHACEDETALVELASRLTATQLEAHVRALPTAPSADPDVERAVHAARYLTWYWDHDGALRLHGRLPATDGAAVVEAIETAAEAIHPPGARAVAGRGHAVGGAPGDGPPPARPGLAARRADALAEIATSGAPPATVVLHTTEETLRALDDGPAVPAETARRLACDATVEDDLGRRRRVVSPPLRKALDRRDGGCRFPGCVRRHGLHAHHIEHWARGGATAKDNLVLLCRFHHRLVHEEGFAIRRCADGELTVHRPGGGEIPTVPGATRAPPALAVSR